MEAEAAQARQRGFSDHAGDDDIGDQGKVRAVGLDGADGQKRDDPRLARVASQPGLGQFGPRGIAPGRPPDTILDIH